MMFRNHSIQQYIIKQSTVWILFKLVLRRGGESYGYTTPIIGAIAAEFFKKGSYYAYYHVVDNWMMSKLYPVTVVIRESTHTTYYLDSKHKYSTGTDYYEYDGRW